MQQMNWVAIPVAAFAGFVIGGLWYGPLFGKAWMKERHLTDADLTRGNMVLIYGTTFLLSVVSAFFLGHLLAHFAPDAQRTMMLATGIALGFIIPALGINYLFSRMSLKLFLIDAGYWLIFYAAMGAVFLILG
jgi:hypothetical protein